MRISDDQRRARLVARHHLGRTAADPVEAVRAVVACHSSDPVTPYLACWARVAGFAIEDLERELYETRSLWRLHAMRRTLFVVAADEAPVLRAGAARAVAAAERRRLEGWLAAEMPAAEVSRWIEDAAERTVAATAAARSTRALTAAVPELSTEITIGSGRWSSRTPVSSRLLFLLALEGRIVRGRPAGTWRSSQYQWADVAAWFPDQPDEPDEAAGRAALLRRYLQAHGPATRTDIRWWTGWTAAHTDAALAEVEAQQVELDGGGAGFVVTDDQDGAAQPPRTVALLPGLDPSTMGWKERDWYLGPHGPSLFDGNGNAGPTVWVGGRIVGGWGQLSDGTVVHQMLEDVDDEATARVSAEAARLTEWLDGTVVSSRFPTPLERALSSPQDP